MTPLLGCSVGYKRGVGRSAVSDMTGVVVWECGVWQGDEDDVVSVVV